ncbi:MAG: glycosyltransferase family 2 protein [Candidatus Microsaccharimonas sp.]
MPNKDPQTIIRNAHKEWVFPDFNLNEINPKNSDYCVCVFVINEGERIQKQLRSMKKYTKSIDIVVADGGSTDGSLEKSFLKEQGIRALLTKTGKGKLSAQMRMAFAWALNEGYKGVVVVDGNGKDDISAIPSFVKLLKEGYDHIQGSRFIPGGKAVNTPLSREIGLHFIHAPLISIASRKRHTDTTNGFRGYSAKLLSDKDISVFRDVFMTYELHYYLAIESSRRKQYRTIEAPVTRTYPKTGKTPTKISPIKGNLHVLGVLFKAVAGKYKLNKSKT